MLKTIERKNMSAEDEMDAEMSRMKRLPRGSFNVKRGETDLKNCKVKITMYLDADIIEYFRKRAEQPHAAPYQTQINSELRKVMDSTGNGAQSFEKDLLNDETFLKALKEKLEKV